MGCRRFGMHLSLRRRGCGRPALPRAAGAAAVPSASKLAIFSSIRSKAPCKAAARSAEFSFPAALSMTPTCESIRSQMRPSAPISRKRQAISRMTRAPLRTGARFCSSARSPTAVVAACRASLNAVRNDAIIWSSRGSRSGCFCAASVPSIRATASSTILVSALRLRLAYSPRNQRPREVSMNASWIAS